MNEQIHFPTEAAAQTALKENGFSLGTSQRDDPRGIMHGDFCIMKWRNLDAKDKEDLHGAYVRKFRDGPVTITLKPNCPPHAATALRRAAAEAVAA